MRKPLAALVPLLLLSATLHAADTQPARKPTLYIIGDSTVKNGRDNGSNGQWGWGHILPFYFDQNKINVENDALGGTSSRTFFETPKLWPAVLDKLQPGDYVIMQFGHNDNTRPPQSDTLRYRSTIGGNGEETVEGPKAPALGGGDETIHTYGWYLRQIIQQTKDKGATPIVCSLIPRDSWKDDKVNISPYAKWAREAADQMHVPFLPLNQLIADTYNGMGRENVTAKFFPAPGANKRQETTHTNWEGAKLNAKLVVTGINDLDIPLKKFLLRNPQDIPAPAAPDSHVKPDSADPPLPK
ncbi:MAG: rhamnogalacturonan acetylesterase [Phycisphaerae bacterium]